MRLICLLFLALLGATETWGGSVRLERSSAQDVSFVVMFETPRWISETHQGAVYRYPRWKGLTTSALIAEPSIPSQIVVVALPPDGEVQLDFSLTTAGTENGVRFIPIPGPLPQTGDIFPRPDLGELPIGPLREGKGYRAREPRPQVELLDLETRRGVRLARVRVSPVSWSPYSETATWARRIKVNLRVSGVTKTHAVPVRENRAFEKLWKIAVINPQSVGDWRELPGRPANKSFRSPSQVLPENWFDDAETWVKIRIQEDGLFRVLGSDLSSLGIDPASLDPEKLRLFSGPLLEDFRWDGYSIKWLHVDETTGFTGGFGEAVNPADGRRGMEEIALSLDLGEDDALDDGDALYFYALGPDGWLSRYGEASPEYYENTYASSTVYWLGIETDYPWPAARVTVQPAQPTGADLATTQRVRLHFEKNREYDPSMKDSGFRWERYFWRRLTPSVGTVEDLVLPEIAEGSLLDVRVRLWGANVPIGLGAERGHHARIDINGVTGTVSWSQSYDHIDTLFTGVPGTPVTRLEAEVVDVPGDPGRIDIIHLTWVEVGYDRMLNVGQVPLEFPYTGVGDGLTVSQLPSGDPWVWDITDFRHPVRLLGTPTDSQVSVKPSRDSGVLLVTGSDQVGKPLSLEIDGHPARWLRDPSQPLDYVIITHDRFAAEAERLAAYRRRHLAGITESRPARVEVVRISDIYDEFSWGMPDPMAIRYFLEYVWRYYGGPHADRLAYCLLVGDTTYDPRNFEGYDVENLVPSWMFNFDSDDYLSYGHIQYVSDDFFGRFDGLNDGSMELAMGRISVATEDEARLVIRDKIIASEESPDRGPWRTKAILIADDVCQGLNPDEGLFGTHMFQTEGVDALIPDAFDRRKIYLYEYGEECLFPTKPEAKRDLLEAWNQGAWLVNYIGHGASVVLADERVLDLEDIPGLANTRRLSLFNAFSCSVGKFSNPALQGIGETVIKGSPGAASAAVVATYLTFSGRNVVLNKAFLTMLFPGEPSDPVPVGAALWMAKATTDLQTGEKYLLMGDPGARIGVPDTMLLVSGVDAVRRGRSEELKVVTRPTSGLLDVIVQDSRELKDKDKNGDPILNLLNGYLRDASTLFRGRSELDSGDTTRVQYITPVTLREGHDGRVRAYAWNDTWDAFGALSPLEAGGQRESPADSLGPVVETNLASGIVIPGQEITLTLEDPAGIDISQLFEFRGILVRMRDLTGAELARMNITESFRYELGSHTRGTASFSVPEVDPGSYELVISSFDNYANRGEITVAVGIGEAGSSSRLTEVYAYPNPLESETRLVFTLDRPGEVEFTVYSVRGRRVTEERMAGEAGRNAWTWSATDALGAPVANGVYLLQVVLKEGTNNSVTRHLERLVVHR